MKIAGVRAMLEEVSIDMHSIRVHAIIDTPSDGVESKMRCYLVSRKEVPVEFNIIEMKIHVVASAAEKCKGVYITRAAYEGGGANGPYLYLEMNCPLK